MQNDSLEETDTARKLLTKGDGAIALRGDRNSLVTGLVLALLGALVALFAGMQDWVGFVAVLVAPIGITLVLHNPTFGLWPIMILIPLAAGAPMGNLFLIINYFLPLLVIYSCLIRSLQLKEVPRQLDSRLHLWFMAFIMCIVGTSFFHSSPASSLVVGFRFFILFLMITVYGNFWSPATIGKGLMGFALALVPLALIALHTVADQGFEGILFGRGDQPQRLTSIFPNPNTFGVFMGHGLVVFMAYLLARPQQMTTLARSFKWILVLIFALILGAGLLISFSRSSYIYCAVALLTLLFTKRRIRWVALGGAGAALASLFVMPLPVWMYLILRVGSGISFRTSLWETGWNMLKDNPLTGIGTGVGIFELHRSEYLESVAIRALLKTPAGSAHNVFLAKGAELGIIGLFLVVSLFVVLLMRVPFHLRRFGTGDWVSGAAAAGVLGLTAHGLFESGASVGMGKLTNGLIFFLFAIVLLHGKKEQV